MSVLVPKVLCYRCNTVWCVLIFYSSIYTCLFFFSHIQFPCYYAPTWVRNFNYLAIINSSYHILYLPLLSCSYTPLSLHWSIISTVSEVENSMGDTTGWPKIIVENECGGSWPLGSKSSSKSPSMWAWEMVQQARPLTVSSEGQILIPYSQWWLQVCVIPCLDSMGTEYMWWKDIHKAKHPHT